MANLPNQKKILIEDFPSQKSWIGALLSPINRFFEDIIRILNKGLTVKENLDGDVLTVTIEGVYPIDVAWNLKSSPKAAFLGQCRELNGVHASLSNALYLDWEYTSSGKFRINNIVGLTSSSSNKFIATIVVFTG